MRHARDFDSMSHGAAAFLSELTCFLSTTRSIQDSFHLPLRPVAPRVIPNENSERELSGVSLVERGRHILG
jgi:hypothetical protein